MTAGPARDSSPLDGLLAFTAAARRAGLPTSLDRDQAFVVAVSELSPASRAGIYWAGRATLCSGPDDRIVYDAVFADWFGSTESVAEPDELVPRTLWQAELATSADGSAEDDQDPRSSSSEREVLRNRDIALLSDAEKQRLWAMYASLRVHQPMRRSHRFDPHARGEVDRAATVRDQLRRAGEPAVVRRRRRRDRPTRVVLLIDVSGSMEPYADALLRLAHHVARGTHGTEVFTLGTRLTRVTRAMRARDPESALELVARSVPDWSGGTRLGEAVGAFNRGWGRRGTARGSVVVLASDGLERGDATMLGDELAALGRIARSIVWVNPHRDKDGYRPVQAGMVAALPHLGSFVAGHSLAAYQEVLDRVGEA
nr:hypothetical protein [Aeromicrobium sp.]